MRLGAFLTHGLLSLVTNVVSDISLTSPRPPPPPILPSHLGHWQQAWGGAAHKLSPPLTMSNNQVPDQKAQAVCGAVGGGCTQGQPEHSSPCYLLRSLWRDVCVLDSQSNPASEQDKSCIFIFLLTYVFLGLLSKAFSPFLSTLLFIPDLRSVCLSCCLVQTVQTVKKQEQYQCILKALPQNASILFFNIKMKLSVLKHKYMLLGYFLLKTLNASHERLNPHILKSTLKCTQRKKPASYWSIIAYIYHKLQQTVFAFSNTDLLF